MFIVFSYPNCLYFLLLVVLIMLLWWGAAKVYNYRYDQLNRIIKMDAYDGLNTNTATFNPIAINYYKENISYDPNGNILRYSRNGNSPTAMDNLTYQYLADKNQLGHVDDSIAAGNYTTDIDDQQSGNYTYDAIGNLITDAAEGITNIDWTVYGKIAAITKANGNSIAYTYDAAGNRISKTTYINGNLNITTVYVRDASGNVMAVYETESSAPAEQREVHLYGSSRLGMVNNLHTRPDTTLTLANGFGKGILSTFTRGAKVFELSNHLGNVLVTISDKKIGVDNNSNGEIDYYMAEVVSATDYYSFGMTMPGRSFNSSTYRYGAGNGQEKSTEINENSYTAEFWQYDARLGRRWNVDPVVKDDESPYMVLGNNPIVMVDPNGADWYKNKKTGDIEYKGKWHGKHKGYESLGKGNGDWLHYEGKDYNKKTGDVINTLEGVTVTTKTKAKNTLANRVLGWANYDRTAAKKWQNNLWDYQRLRNKGVSAEDAGAKYEGLGTTYERYYQAEQDWREMNYAILDGATFFVPVPKVGMLRWVRYGGRTFQEAKVAIWAKNAKPVFQPIRDVATGKTFKVYAEIHHRFVPQRWGLPNWITNSRFNLQITNSIEHGLIDPFRHQFFPRWVKEGIKEGTISAENVIRLR